MVRKSAPPYFAALDRLKCCEVGGLGADQKEARDNSLTIILVHRDDFGHGEEGDKSDYGRKRQSVLDSLHMCRIIQAQQFLIERGLAAI
jgi:hypothetical protein